MRWRMKSGAAAVAVAWFKYGRSERVAGGRGALRGRKILLGRQARVWMMELPAVAADFHEIWGQCRCRLGLHHYAPRRQRLLT